MFAKIYSFFIAVFLQSLFAFGTVLAQSDSDAYRIEHFTTSSSPAVDISTSGGFVHVFGYDSPEVQVRMFVRRGNRYLSPSDTDLSDFDIVIRKEGDRVTASAKREERGWTRLFGSDRNISISFEVFVPSGALVNGHTSGGSITAEDISNDLVLKTSGGSVTAKRIHGKTDLRTSGGSITLEDLSGAISARTSGGSIRVNSLAGEADLHTSGGSIRIENSAGKLSARTSGGSIRGQFVSFEEDIYLRTSGGSIRIDLPPVEHFDLDLSGNRVRAELRNFTGSSERNSIRGQIGNGGPTIAAHTSGGTVELNY